MTQAAAPGAGTPGPPRLVFDRHEIAGAFGDLGVLVPIAVAMIVVNGLSATAVVVPAGILYVVSGLVFRVPVPVQPLKAFGAIAIASGLGVAEISAGAILLGALFVVLGVTGALDRAARLVPRPLVRGVQVTVGLLFLEVAAGLVLDTPTTFADADRSGGYLVGGAVVVALAALLLRGRGVTLVLLAVAVAAMAVRDGAPVWGPAPVHAPDLTLEAFTVAAVTLVLPQVPLTFANSCLGTADAARTYFGARADRVRPGRLAVSLGLTNLAVGAVGGLPVCHGAGGMTAHRAFGARTGGAPVVMGTTLLVLGLGVGAGLAGLLAGFPVPILAGLLAVAGLLHVALLRDLTVPAHRAVAVGVGLLGAVTHLGIALAVGLALWWGSAALRARRGSRRRDPAPRSPSPTASW